MVNAGDGLVNYLYDSVPERDFVFGAIPALWLGCKLGQLTYCTLPCNNEREKNPVRHCPRDLQKLARVLMMPASSHRRANHIGWRR